METKATTVKDILTDVLNILNGINVPMKEFETIGIPIGQSINGIKICIEAFERHDRELEEQEAKAKQGDETTDKAEIIELHPEDGQDG